MEHKGPVLRPRCSWPGRPRTPNTILYVNLNLGINIYIRIYVHSITHWVVKCRFVTGTLTYLITYLLTQWCRILLEQLTGLQLVKKFPAFHGTRTFITALTSFRHLSLSWASPIQSIYPHPTSWRSILILSTHLQLVVHICTTELRASNVYRITYRFLLLRLCISQMLHIVFN